MFPGPIALSVEVVVEVLPLGVAALDQPDLPGAGPSLGSRPRASLAAGEDGDVLGHCHALTPMGPGNKSRDDIAGAARASR